MANKIFLLGLFLLSVANVKAQTQTQTDSLTMETMLHNLPEVMVKGSRPIVKAERGMLSYNMPLLLKQLPADNAYEALTRRPGVSDATGSMSFLGNEVTLIINGQTTTLTQEQLAERLNGNNIFNNKYDTRSVQGNQDYLMKINYNWASVTFTVIYKFGGYKEKTVKEVDTSRMGH